MRKLLLAILGLICASAARADMYQDASNAKLPTVGTPTSTVCATALGGLFSSTLGCNTPLSFAVGVPNPNSSWVPAFWPNTTQAATINSISPTGGYAVVGASRSSDNGGNIDGAGIFGLVKNDNTVSTQGGAWAGYFDATSGPGVKTPTQGVEIDVGNRNIISNIDPYTFSPSQLTVDLWLACGGAGFGGTGGNLPCTTAIGILPNTQPFTKGIVFAHNALVATNGIAGNGIAFELADRQTMKWSDSSQDTAEIWGETNGGFAVYCNEQGLPPSRSTTLYICGNRTGSLGEVDFLNDQENAGGFVFRQKTGASTSAVLGVMNAQGIALQQSTVAALPVCNSGNSGFIRAVTDAASPAWNATLAGGGSSHVMAFCNGTVWTAH